MFKKTRQIIRNYIENRNEYSKNTDFYSDQVLWWQDKTLEVWKHFEENWVQLKQIEEILIHDYIINWWKDVEAARKFIPMMNKFLEWCYFNNIKRDKADKIKREIAEEVEDFNLDSFK